MSLYFLNVLASISYVLVEFRDDRMFVSHQIKTEHKTPSSRYGILGITVHIH